MAESIVKAKLAAPRNGIVVHFDGAFHSDYAQGIVVRVRWRKVVVISAVRSPILWWRRSRRRAASRIS